MSRGRPPRMACREACARAAQRGMVLDAAALAKAHIDAILFSGQRVTFVRVKRSHSHICAPVELTSRFSSEIAGLRTVPLTPVVSRELWVLLPWGSWQHFCIGDDTITGIHEDAGKIPGLQPVPIMATDRRDPVPAAAGAGKASPPEPGPVSPEVTLSKEQGTFRG